MASTPKRRGRGRVQQNMRGVTIQPTLPLGTLLTKDTIAGTLIVASDTEYRLLNVNASWTWDSIQNAGEGPIMVGIAAGDYSLAEIEEAIESFGSVSIGNRIEQEHAQRLVRQVAVLDEVIQTANDGLSIKVKLNWKVPIGKTVQLFAYNMSGATIATGSAVLVMGTALVKFL